jgi:hypothetical protein
MISPLTTTSSLAQQAKISTTLRSSNHMRITQSGKAYDVDGENIHCYHTSGSH